VQLVFILEQVLNGLLVGAYYLLIALGLSLIFALGGIVNLAHGGFYAIGAYLAVVLADRIGFGGALIVSPLAVGFIGVAIERLLFRRFYRSDPILSLLLTFGLAMVIEQGLRIVFGASPLPFSIPPELRGQIFVGDFIYSRYRLVILAVAVAAVTATWLIVYRTPFGRVVRAGVQNPDVVGALGISLAPYMTAIAVM
jgi:branched-chain amino acid transport system permease protein